MTDAKALNVIAWYMNGRKWDADTLELIADAVRKTGRKVAYFEEEGEGDEYKPSTY